MKCRSIFSELTGIVVGSFFWHECALVSLHLEHCLVFSFFSPEFFLGYRFSWSDAAGRISLNLNIWIAMCSTVDVSPLCVCYHAVRASDWESCSQLSEERRSDRCTTSRPFLACKNISMLSVKFSSLNSFSFICFRKVHANLSSSSWTVHLSL